MNAKLVWLLEKYNYRSQTHIGGSSSHTHEICDLYLTEKELHQLHLDEEALRETLKEAAMDEKAREEKIRQKQADDEEFFLEFEVEFGLDIDDSDLHLTLVLRSSNCTRVEPSPLTSNPVRIIPGPAGIVQLSSSRHVEPYPSTLNLVRIIPGPAGIVQQAKLLKENVCILDSDGALMSTQEYMHKVVEDVERAEMYCECMEPFKSLMCLWVRNKSIAAIWLEKVVTPLIEPSIKCHEFNLYRIPRHLPRACLMLALEDFHRHCDYHKNITLMLWHNHEDNAIWLWLILSHNKLGSCRSDSYNLLTVSASKGHEHNKQTETHILIPQLTAMYNLVSLGPAHKFFAKKLCSTRSVGNKMHKAFPLPGESSRWQCKFPLPVEGVPTVRRIEIPLPGV
nr:hypothetical protein [Tanacetum cinerariifolium]